MTSNRLAIGSSPPADAYDPRADALGGLGTYAAPWSDAGAEYLPLSPRSGRMVAQATAEREWAESFNSVPTPQHGHGGGGFWDHDADLATRQAAINRALAEGRTMRRPWPTKSEPRYDDERMRAALGDGADLTAHQLEVYLLFWRGRLSYNQVARRIGSSAAAVRTNVKRLRRKVKSLSSEW